MQESKANLTHLLFRFDGRIDRGKFWTGMVLVFVAAAIGFGLFAIGNPATVAIAVVVFIGAVWMSLALYIKRLHDIGRSGWWVLVGFIPYVGSLILLVWLGLAAGNVGENEYGMSS